MNRWILIIVFNVNSVKSNYCNENHVCCMEPRVVLETCINSNTFKMNFSNNECFLKVCNKHVSIRFKMIA